MTKKTDNTLSCSREHAIQIRDMRKVKVSDIKLRYIPTISKLN